MPDRPPAPDVRLLIAIVVAGSLAVATLAGVLAGSHVGDDFNLNYNLAKDTDGIVVLWDEIWKEFARPFIGSEGWPYFRPLASFWIAVLLATFGYDPVAFHAGNLVHHAVVSICTAWLCWLYVPRARFAAALAGGAFCALHPIAVEPVAWWSAYTSSQCVCLTACCLAAFAAYRHYGGRRWYAFSLVLAALALLAKEPAAVLPVSLLVLDLLHPAKAAVAPVLRRQLPFVPIWVGYLALRIGALGGFLPGHEDTVSASIADQLTIQLDKFEAVFWPFGDGLAPLEFGIASAGLGVLVIFAMLRSRALAVTVVLGAVWLATQFAPSFGHRVTPDLSGSRVIYVALPIAALLVTAALWGSGGPAVSRSRAVRWLSVGLFAGVLAGALASQRARLDAYRAAWDHVDSIRTTLVELAAGATPTSPVAIVTRPENLGGVPGILRDMSFPLGERPYAPEDLPVLGLTFVYREVPASSELLGDASPLRAMRELGANLLYYYPTGVPLRGTERDPRPPAVARPRPGSLRFDAPTSGHAVEALAIEVRGATTAGTVRWVTDVDEHPAYRGLPDELRGQAFAVPPATGGEARRVVVDLSHNRGLLDTRVFGGIRGLEVELDGDGAVVGCELIERLPELDLPARLAGATLRLGDESDTWTAPGVEAAVLRVVVLSPSSGVTFPVTPGAPVRFPESVRREFRRVLKLSRQRRFYCWFEAAPTSTDRAPRRSAVDWFSLQPADH